MANTIGAQPAQSAQGGIATTRKVTPQDTKLEQDNEKIVDEAVAAFLDAGNVEVPDGGAVESAVETKDDEPKDETGLPVPKTPEQKPPEPKKDEPSSRAALAIMRREAELTKRETAVKEQLAKAQAALAEVQKTQQGAQDATAVIALAKRDPIGFFKQLKLDTGEVGRLLLADAMGDKAPEQYRNRAAQWAEKSEAASAIEALRAEMVQMRTQLAAKEYATEMQAGASSYAPDPTKLPLVANFAEKNRQQFNQEIVREILDDARARMPIEGPSAQAITVAEAAARIERRLSTYGLQVGPKTSTTDSSKKTATTSKKTALQTRVPKQIDETEDYEAIVESAKADFLNFKD